MLAIGNNEPKKGPLGETIKCPHCGENHDVGYSDMVLANGTKQPSKALAFYRCGGVSYLCGIDGREI